MKIIQICGLIEGAGITKYINEVNIGLTLLNHDVTIYEFPNNEKSKLTEQGNFERKCVLFDYDNQEMIDDIESADLVFVNQLISKKATDEYKEKFFDFIENKITKPVKVIFFNDHSSTTAGFSRMYGHKFKDKHFLLSFDKYVIHCDYNAYARTIKKIIGEEEFNKRYVHLHHPHYFDESKKNLWVSLKNKYKRACYIGRNNTIKHVEEIPPFRDALDGDFEFEVRGINREIGNIFIPGLFYDFDDSGIIGSEHIVGPAKNSWTPSLKWKLENGFDKNDPMIDFKHPDDKILCLGTYKYSEGMEAIRKAAFGMEFYRLKTAGEHGDNLEYCMHEIVEQGTIPIFDAFACRSIKVYKNGLPTDQSLYDANIGLYLEQDFSNVQEIRKRMNEIYDNEELYEDYRNRAWNILKQHLDPEGNMRVLIEDCMR